jgi:F0F1-type ATP synthase epsilon subunit
MPDSFRCRLITPEAQVLDEPAVSAVIPCWDGMLGVLPHRAAMVSELGTGELRIDFADRGSARGGSRSFFISDGFVQMLNNSLTILAANAVGAEHLSETDAQTELNALNARRTENMTADDLARYQKDKARAEAKLAAARTFKAKGGF